MSFKYYPDEFIDDRGVLAKSIGAAAAYAKRLNALLFSRLQDDPTYRPVRKVYYFAGEKGLIREYADPSIKLVPDMADAIVFFDGIKWRFTAIQRINPRLVVDNIYGHYEFEIQIDVKAQTAKFELVKKETSYSDNTSRTCDVINTGLTKHNPLSFAIRRVWRWAGSPALYITTIDVFYDVSAKKEYSGDLPQGASWIGHTQFTISKSSTEQDWDQIHYNVADPTSLPQNLPKIKDCWWIEDDYTKYLVTPFGAYSVGASECPNTLYALNSDGKCIAKKYWRFFDENGYWKMEAQEWESDDYNKDVTTGTAYTVHGDFVNRDACNTILRAEHSCEECTDCAKGLQYIFHCSSDEYLSYTCWDGSYDPYWNTPGDCWGKSSVPDCVWNGCMTKTGPPFFPYCLGAYHESGGVIDFCSFSNPTLEADHSYWVISYIGSSCDVEQKYENRKGTVLMPPSFWNDVGGISYNPGTGMEGNGWTQQLVPQGTGGLFYDITETMIYKKIEGELHPSNNRCLDDCWTTQSGCGSTPCCNECVGASFGSCFKEDGCCTYGGGPLDIYSAQHQHVMAGIEPNNIPIIARNLVFDFHITRDFLDKVDDATPHRGNISTYSNCTSYACPNATEADISIDFTCKAICWDRFPDFTCEDWNACRSADDPECDFCKVSHESHDKLEGHFYYKGELQLEGENVSEPYCMSYSKTTDMAVALVADKLFFFNDKDVKLRLDISETIKNLIEEHEGSSIVWNPANTMAYLTRG